MRHGLKRIGTKFANHLCHIMYKLDEHVSSIFSSVSWYNSCSGCKEEKIKQMGEKNKYISCINSC